jgi:hypothetical protein
MVGPVLRVVVFEHERVSLDAIIMRFATLESAGPGKIDSAKTALLDLGPFVPATSDDAGPDIRGLVL